MTGAPTSNLEDFRRASDRRQAEEVRALAQIDGAVRNFHRGVIRPVHVSVELAEQLGWPLCACGAGGVRPGAFVTYGGRGWHVDCAIAAAVDVAVGGARAVA